MKIYYASSVRPIKTNYLQMNFVFLFKTKIIRYFRFLIVVNSNFKKNFITLVL
jgi:hypothetical protein